MKFFFDNNLSLHIAHAIRELSKREDDISSVIHLRDRFEPSMPDVEWIGSLGQDGPWCILSIDRFRKNHDAEREALRRQGHTVFVLDSHWAKYPFWLQAERLVRWWPQILAQARLVSAGHFRVPWSHSSKSKFAAIRI
ncbi:MAG: hypothetical protein ABIN08_17180 [Caldimonas sp.]